MTSSRGPDTKLRKLLTLIIREFKFILTGCYLNYFFQYVPCIVRTFLADYIDERKEEARKLRKEQVEPALLTHEGRSYNALFKHRENYTKFCGGEWNIFAADYELRAGDRIEFELPYEGLKLELQTYRDDKRLLPLPHVGRYLIFQTYLILL